MFMRIFGQTPKKLILMYICKTKIADNKTSELSLFYSIYNILKKVKIYFYSFKFEINLF